jgi:uncharacterized Rmd1/YagE family protein
MAVYQCHAYGFAAQFKVREVAACFTGARLRLSKTQAVAEYQPDGWALAFDFGAVVFVNVSAEERARVLGEIRRRVATDEPHPPLEEDFLIETVPGTPAHGRVSFDRVMVDELNAPSVELIALLLAQSVAIDYYEEDLQEVLASLDRRTEAMAVRGKLSGSRSEVIKFVARTLSTKNQIIAALAVLDKPLVTWERESLDKLYRALHEMLEIADRFRALEYKLRTIQDSLELILDMHQTRQSHFLELTIIGLIVFEILMAFVSPH